MRLRRSSLDQPGIRRRRRGRGFSYSWETGQPVTDPEVLARIKALVIPPAWKDVWICPWPQGHIQAVGVDAAGRRQYRYHDAWRVMRDREKFRRVVEFGRQLPGLRSQVLEQLGVPGMPAERVLAAAVRLMDVASLRVGGEEYANDHETYGLATLLKRHVRVTGDVALFTFEAKSGQRVHIEVDDPQVVPIVGELRSRRSGGPELLAWREGRRWVDLRSVDVNAYIKASIGDRFSAKDFRTWNATVWASIYLAQVDPLPETEVRRRRAVAGVVKQVAAHLCNTPSVARASYIDPRPIEAFQRGETIGPAPIGPDRPRESFEPAVLALLGQEETPESRAVA